MSVIKLVLIRKSTNILDTDIIVEECGEHIDELQGATLVLPESYITQFKEYIMDTQKSAKALLTMLDGQSTTLFEFIKEESDIVSYTSEYLNLVIDEKYTLADLRADIGLEDLTQVEEITEEEETTVIEQEELVEEVEEEEETSIEEIEESVEDEEVQQEEIIEESLPYFEEEVQEEEEEEETIEESLPYFEEEVEEIQEEIVNTKVFESQYSQDSDSYVEESIENLNASDKGVSRLGNKDSICSLLANIWKVSEEEGALVEAIAGGIDNLSDVQKALIVLELNKTMTPVDNATITKDELKSAAEMVDNCSPVFIKTAVLELISSASSISERASVESFLDQLFTIIQDMVNERRMVINEQ